MKPVLCVVGARPNFIKMAPILRAMAAHRPPVPALLVHTGQHYDHTMSERLFAALGLPQPAVNLEVGSGSHTLQTTEVMRRFLPLLDTYQPSAVLVVGDVNSTLACALVARQCGVPVLHVESGLRSFDRDMPEELNRVLTDQIADRHYTTELGATANLAREGIAVERVQFVGNVMIDSVVHGKVGACNAHDTLRRWGVNPALLDDPHGYAVLTLHRPSNVDDAATLRGLLLVMQEVASALPLLFVTHPRTRACIHRFALSNLLRHPRMAMLPPQDYLEMLGLVANAQLVLTDSGGLQEETTALGVPCLTLRDNTERPVTVEQGTNTLVGRERTAILGALQSILNGHGKCGRIPQGWDGHAAERIVSDLYQWLAPQPQARS
jgi:UDP-N-acetylglucosamine 2-epimerase (non-hydrolysing)